MLIYAYITKTGPKQQDKPAKEFVLNLYMACNPDPERQTYSHFTTATGVFAMKNNATIYTMLHLVLSYSPCCIHSVISLWLKWSTIPLVYSYQCYFIMRILQNASFHKKNALYEMSKAPKTINSAFNSIVDSSVHR